MSGPDDGIDPKLLFTTPRRRDEKKERRLCAEVRDVLTYALAECRDALLQSLLVVAVDPAPDASRLAVSVAPQEDADSVELERRLQLVAGRLRSEVATTVRRRRAPELVFRVVRCGEVGP